MVLIWHRGWIRESHTALLTCLEVLSPVACMCPLHSDGLGSQKEHSMAKCSRKQEEQAAKTLGIGLECGINQCHCVPLVKAAIELTACSREMETPFLNGRTAENLQLSFVCHTYLPLRAELRCCLLQQLLWAGNTFLFSSCNLSASPDLFPLYSRLMCMSYFSFLSQI